MRRKVLAETQKAHDAAIAGNLRVPEGAGAIIAAAYAKSFLAKLRPQRAGNRLSVAVELDVSATGAMAAVSVTGMLAGVAIPAFMDYTKRSKKTEASLQLNKLAKSAKRAFLESNAFPQGSTTLTPPQPCCGSAGGTNHCPAAPELFAKDPVWRALDFQIDEPTLFQYEYRGSSDGQSFVAHAVSDLDCDGVTITYELKGEQVNGRAARHADRAGDERGLTRFAHIVRDISTSPAAQCVLGNAAAQRYLRRAALLDSAHRKGTAHVEGEVSGPECCRARASELWSRRRCDAEEAGGDDAALEDLQERQAHCRGDRRLPEGQRAADARRPVLPWPEQALPGVPRAVCAKRGVEGARLPDR